MLKDGLIFYRAGFICIRLTPAGSRGTITHSAATRFNSGLVRRSALTRAVEGLRELRPVEEGANVATPPLHKIP